MKKEIQRQDLQQFLNALLSANQFEDYAPNGLQIEGSNKISKIVFAVSATRDSIAKTIIQKADTLIVHHGLFWKFHGVRPIVGPLYRRIAPLIQNNINLFAYHLPLDAHLGVGNAAQIAQKINLNNLKPFGDYKGSATGVWGTFSRPQKADHLKNKLEKILNHSVLHSYSNLKQTIKTTAIISGGANSGWQDAHRLNLDAYITGEMSEHDWHDSSEAGVHMFAGGHNATERFGPQALLHVVQKHFDISCIFIDSPNPA